MHRLQVNTINRLELASRLTLNCASSRVHPERIRGLQSVTIMDVFDEYALCSPVREEIYDAFPSGKLAQMKTGGNFVYLSKHEEVNVHIKVRLVAKILFL